LPPIGVELVQIKDALVKKNLRWHILRLLRLSGRTRGELVGKIDDMYLGCWPLNDQLIDSDLSRLIDDGLIKYSDDKYEITEAGSDALKEKERKIEQHLARGLSKEACAAYSLMGNVGLSALEFVVGLLSGSVGLIADAVHTAVDIVASAITWIGIKIEREAQAALLGGVILCGIGAFIAFESITKIFEPAEINFQAVALVTIVINIAVNGFFSYYKFYVGGRTKSISLIADAYHTKTDIWSSAAVLIGLLGAAAGFPVLDAVAGVAVSLFIILGGGELIAESKKVLEGEDPRMEKFSRFLESHLRALPDRAAFVILWFLNLSEMAREENLERVKRSFGRRYPIELEDEDYEAVYARLERDGLVESVGGRLRLTGRGREELMRLAEMPVTYMGWTGRKSMNARKIDWFAEGL
jgi:cation diffusion facilitator family transporter